MKILKFGGSSASTPERITGIIRIVKPYLSMGEPITLVFSAFGGVTDSLIRLSDQALAGDDHYESTLRDLEARHVEAVRALVGIQRQSAILASVKSMINELDDVIHGIFLVKERTPRMLDFVMSFGERLSAFIIREAFEEQKVICEFLDARRIIRTDDQFGYARVDFQVTNDLIQAHFKSHEALQIVTGFVASSPTGETTTLGRSGSDYTAAILAGALRASSLEIWTDVDGMMTADPRKVKKAFTVHEMTYEEAMELSHFGAKVIFPATMQPAMINRIPIWIRNTFNPSFPGTVIHAGNASHPVAQERDLIIKGISSMNRMSLLSVQGTGLLGVVGVSMRLFAALARVNVNVILISQASSEHSICFAVDSTQASRAREAIEKEFIYEIKNMEMEPVMEEASLAIVAIVGENMRHNPGTSGRMFHALGKNGINIYAIAQGSSELNISAVIREADVSKALNVLHEAFFLSDKRVAHVFLVGTGLIGGELLRMISSQFAELASRNLLEVHVVAVANSRKMLFNEEGLDLQTAVAKMKDSGELMLLQDFVARMKSMNLPNSIFVDCTSSEKVAAVYQEILDGNISIVTPNKKANSGPLENYRQLKQTAFRRGTRFLYETNVGAGLPVINTLNDLLLSGDKVIRVEAVLSGTLNFIFSTFNQEKPFSAVVREAKEKGYTEPDPRDDLSGVDVARKILILARESGASLELSDVSIGGLVPDDCLGDISTDEFLRRLAGHDAAFGQRLKAAQAVNQKLRFMAVFENDQASVGLVNVDADHPFYALQGTDNVILLTTDRYKDRPMVIKGPGAGAAVTAAGVFADIIRIGNYSTK